MELNDALRIPLAPSVVRASLEDIALLRASFDHCESFVQLAHGEYALTLTVPLGPLRARYDVRAHITSEQGDAEGQPRRILNFKARADGIGALRGQIEIVLYPDASADDATRIEYVVWATATGPLAELPARQIEHALHEWADDFSANSARSCRRSTVWRRILPAPASNGASMCSCGLRRCRPERSVRRSSI